MSSIQVQCDQCRRRFAAKPHLAGKRVRCPGCGSAIDVPKPAAARTALDITCDMCFTEFQAPATRVAGSQVPCPTCGSNVTVGTGQKAGSAASQASLLGISPPASPAAGSPFASRMLAPDGGATESGFLARHWLSAVVGLVAFASLGLCVVAGRFLAGGAFLVVGMAVAGSGFLFGAPKARRRKSKSSGGSAAKTAATAGGVMLFVLGALARVMRAVNRHGKADAEWIGTAAGVFLVFAVLIGLLIGFIYLVSRFGFFRPAAFFYTVAALGLPVLWNAFSLDWSPQGQLPQTASMKSQPLPSFPPLGAPRQIAPGVDFREVRLPVPAGTPGHYGTLYVYTPQGPSQPKSKPCVFIASAGATPFTGMELGTADQPEHIPFAQAGYVVMAYEIDGYLADSENASDQQYLRAMEDYWASSAGLVNARNAIEFALARIPEVDPQRLYSAGHSSAGLQSLLLAENEPRIKACIAYAPVVDLEDRVRDMLPALRQTIPNFNVLLQLGSPRAHESKLRCPVFLFHARDDESVPVAESAGLADRLRRQGTSVQLVVVPSGGHYDSMIAQGVPRAIEWLRQYSRVRGAAVEPSGGPAPGAPPGRVAAAGSAPASAAPAPDSAASNVDDRMKRMQELQRKVAKLMEERGNRSAGELHDKFAELMREELEGFRSDFPDQEAQKMIDEMVRETMPSSGQSGGSENPFTESPFDAVQKADELAKLLRDVTSENVFQRRDAIRELARTTPDKVASQTMREKIVEKLNGLAVSSDVFTQREAIKALGSWGNDASVDLLIGLLTDPKNRGSHTDVLQALGRLKAPDAALPVAQRLGDFFDRREAQACLLSMGPVAEDALIVVAPSDDKDVCLAAVMLLGQVGTEKCLPTLRQAQRSRNADVREAAKNALRQVRLREASQSDTEKTD